MFITWLLLFFTTSTGTGNDLSKSNLSTLVYKLLKLAGTFFSLLISNLSTVDFKRTKDDVSIPVILFKPVFGAQWNNCNSTFTFPKDFGSGKYWLIYTMPFLLIQLLNELLHPFHLTYNLSPFPFITFSILTFS